MEWKPGDNGSKTRNQENKKDAIKKDPSLYTSVWFVDFCLYKFKWCNFCDSFICFVGM